MNEIEEIAIISSLHNLTDVLVNDIKKNLRKYLSDADYENIANRVKQLMNDIFEFVEIQDKKYGLEEEDAIRIFLFLTGSMFATTTQTYLENLETQ